MKLTADIQFAGKTEYVLSPNTFKASRTATVAPHPAQAYGHKNTLDQVNLLDVY